MRTNTSADPSMSFRFVTTTANGRIRLCIESDRESDSMGIPIQRWNSGHPAADSELSWQ